MFDPNKPHVDPKRPHSVRMMVSITDSDKTKAVTALLQQAHIHLHYQFRALGTAGSEITDFLGLSQTTKTVTFCLVPKLVSARLLERVEEELRLKQPGSGIAFTLPVSGASSPILRLLDEEVREQLKQEIESEVNHVMEQAVFSLIMITVNQGYSEDVMDAARKAGASGGTVIHARRLGLDEPVNFCGMVVQPEREVIAILTPKERKLTIMREVGKACGMSTEAQGLVLSIPVEDAVGLEIVPFSQEQ